jgi:hypothetical protein
MRAAATRLCINILLNCSIEFYGTCIDALLTDLLAKKKAHVHECVLQILRGRYYVDTRLNARARIHNNFSISLSYGYLTRPVQDESTEAIADRIKVISEALFLKKKGPIGMEFLDTCVDIVVQMAAQK